MGREVQVKFLKFLVAGGHEENGLGVMRMEVEGLAAECQFLKLAGSQSELLHAICVFYFREG